MQYSSTPEQQRLSTDSPTASTRPSHLGDGRMGKTISIVSVSGVVVKNFVVHALRQTVDISALSAGLYFIQGQNGSERISQKLVKL